MQDYITCPLGQGKTPPLTEEFFCFKEYYRSIILIFPLPETGNSLTQKSIFIIGAEVAGLCNGIYGQMNDYQTRIFEKHKIPGGLVTAFRRKGYLVDLCIHWMPDSAPGFYLHRYWNEVGLPEKREFLQHDRYGVYYAQDGCTVNFYYNPDLLEKHFPDISLQDACAIHEMVEGVRFCIRFKLPEKELYEAEKESVIRVYHEAFEHI
jgi:phytoene dehydrogenase-like protein